MTAGRPARVAAKGLLAAIALGLTWGAIELPAALGLVDYRDLFRTPAPAWKRKGNRPDPELIYLRDGSRAERGPFLGGEYGMLAGATKWKVYTNDARFDRAGFRNPREIASAEIAVVGDSFVEGLQVNDAELMTTRLAALSGRSVANLGRSGDGPQQARHVLERFALPLGPKVCVWLFYEGNDLEDAAEYERNHALVTGLKPPTAARLRAERSFARNASLFVRRTWIEPEPKRPASAYTGIFASRDHGPVPLSFAAGDHHRAGDRDPARLARATAAIAEAHDLCRREGVRLIVAFVPTKWRVYRDLCRFGPGAVCPRWNLDDLPDRMREFAEGRGLAYLDLTPGFKAEAAQGALLYLPDDTHWTASGHDTAARAIASRLDGDAGPTGSRPPDRDEVP